MSTLTDQQYQMLFTVRYAMRHYLQWSERQAAEVGLTPQQHQLLLAVRAHAAPLPPSIGDLAGYLMVRPNSTIELVGRAEAIGFVARAHDTNDQRIVRVSLTPHGESLLDELTGAHLQELERVAERLHLSEQFLHQLSADFITETSPAADGGA
jgi:DNA-binding MarR family transcriptional regulator